MKTALRTITTILALAVFNTSTLLVQAQFDVTVTITRYNGPGGAVVIPSEMNGMPVTAIGDGAFAGNKTITSVAIPGSVLAIGGWAFESCQSLTNVTMSNGVASIGGYAFSDCPGLASITIPNSVTTIGYSAFQGCASLTAITIPSSVMSVGAHAFDYSGVTAIIVDPLNSRYSSWEGVLFDNTQTILVQYPPGRTGPYTVPDSVTNIAYAAFANCTNLTSILIPSGVYGIEGSAFAGCLSLTNITIPDSVTAIGDGAFALCVGLNSVVIPASVRSIGDRAFEGTSLTAFFLDDLNPNYSSADGVLFDKNQTTLIQYPAGKTGAYTVPDSVTNIAPEAFHDCTNLTEVTISNRALAIADWAFYGCSGLTNVMMPNGVTSIGRAAFGFCRNLLSVTMADGETSIREEAFLYCDSLKSITIPNGITTIADSAFRGCHSLTNVTVPAGITNIGAGAFESCWALGSINIAEGVTSIGNGAFEGCSDLASVTLPNTLTEIGDSAFRGSGLAGLTIPNSVTRIGDAAFVSCYKLTDIAVGSLNSVYGSLEGVLFDKNRTTLITYPAGKTGTFYRVPESVTSIESSAFSECTMLTISIPGSVTNIEQPAFVSCRSLTAIDVESLNSVYSSVDGVLFDKPQDVLIRYPAGRAGNYVVPNGITRIADYAFERCLSLTSVSLPNTLGLIGTNAFAGCASLDGIDFPDSVIQIGRNAFASCSSLVAVALGENVTTVGDYAFSGCSHLTIVTVPNSVVNMGIDVFFSCASLTALCFEGNAPILTVPYNWGLYFPWHPWHPDNATVYYLPGTTGWGATFDNRPTAPWVLPYPVILSNNGSFGVRNSALGFTISWATNGVVVVEACTDLTQRRWVTVSTNTLSGGWSYFSDPDWTNYPACFYRLRSP